MMRTVLVDLPVLRGIPNLAGGYAITAGDIEEALAATRREPPSSGRPPARRRLTGASLAF